MTRAFAGFIQTKTRTTRQQAGQGYRVKSTDLGRGALNFILIGNDVTIGFGVLIFFTPFRLRARY